MPARWACAAGHEPSAATLAADASLDQLLLAAEDVGFSRDEDVRHLAVQIRWMHELILRRRKLPEE